eukprot:6176975-Pleurochrysis_carterae.AAC.1
MACAFSVWLLQLQLLVGGTLGAFLPAPTQLHLPSRPGLRAHAVAHHSQTATSLTGPTFISPSIPYQFEQATGTITKPAFIFLPGIEGTGYSISKQVEEMSADFELIYLNVPATDRSRCCSCLRQNHRCLKRSPMTSPYDRCTQQSITRTRNSFEDLTTLVGQKVRDIAASTAPGRHRAQHTPRNRACALTSRFCVATQVWDAQLRLAMSALPSVSLPCRACLCPAERVSALPS